LIDRLRKRRLATAFAVLATLTAAIVVGSYTAHGVHGQAKTDDSSDATPLKVPNTSVAPNEFAKIAKQSSAPRWSTSTPAPCPRRPATKARAVSIPTAAWRRSNSSHPMTMKTTRAATARGRIKTRAKDKARAVKTFRTSSTASLAARLPGDGWRRSGRRARFARLRLHRRCQGLHHHQQSRSREGRRDLRQALHRPRQHGPGRKARVIGVDKATDLAVIKIETDKPLPTVKLGNSDGTAVGDWVIAIGSPFSLSQTVTAGIISAKNRTIEPGVAGQFQHFIQTDAAINPGNSGGPLST
jgi:serine protease Do